MTLPLNGGKGRGGPVPLSTSINLQPRTRPLSSTFPDSLLLDSPKKKWVGDDGPPQFKNGTGGGQMSDVWDGVKKKERNRKCRGQEEKAGGTGWMNGGERRGTYSR